MNNTILISIPTYKRPLGLQKAVNSILKNMDNFNEKIEVLIVDNDPLKSGKKTTANLQKIITQFKIHYVSEPQNGLSNVRNRILQEAQNLNATYLLSFDDDEIIEQNWIASHIKLLRDKKCEVSSGATLSIMPPHCPKWIIKGNFFRLFDKRENYKRLKKCAGGNFGLDMDFIKKHSLTFDLRFNNIGGEDTDFFKTLNDLSGVILHNKNAIAYEIIPIERCTFKYVFLRDFRIGFARGVKQNKYNQKQMQLKTIQNIFALLFYIAILPINIWSIHTLYKNICKIGKTLGFLKYAIGGTTKAYGE